MKNTLRIVIALVIAIAMTACSFELPDIKSASAERYAGGAIIQSWVLNEGQLNALSLWVKQHRSGWSTSHVSYVPAIEVRISHENGFVTVVNILSGNKVVAYNNAGQYEQKFEESEFEKLLGIVAPMAANPSFNGTGFQPAR